MRIPAFFACHYSYCKLLIGYYKLFFIFVYFIAINYFLIVSRDVWIISCRFCGLPCRFSNFSCHPVSIYSEYLQYKFVSLPGNIRRGQDLLQVIAYDYLGQHLTNSTFKITENNTGYNFRIRIADGKGIIYTLEDLRNSTQYDLEVQAKSYIHDEQTFMYKTSFAIYIYLSAYPF